MLLKLFLMVIGKIGIWNWMSSWNRLYGVFVNDPQLFEIKDSYVEMDQQLTSLSDASFQASSPLFEQRQKQMEESEIYRYLFTGFTMIIAVLLCVSVIVITRKETDGYRQAFAFMKEKTDIKGCMGSRLEDIMIY